jgi:Fe-S cluster assembly protein SufD
MNAAVKSPAATRYREAFERVRPALRGPAAARDAAIARFTELGFPGPREEAWKYTNLRRLESRNFEPAPEVAQAPLPALPVALASHRLVMLNGRWQRRAGLDERQVAGFDVRTLDGQTDEQAAALLRVLPGGGTERFSALNAALSAPLLLETKKNARSDDVLQLTLYAAAAGPIVASPRIVVRMAPGSRGRLLLDHGDDDAQEYFVNAVLDIQLAAGAELHVYRLQQHGPRAFHIERLEAELEGDARLVVRDTQLGAGLARLDAHVALSGRGAQVELSGVFLADGTRHLDTHLHVAHRAIGTESVQDYRGIAANRGRGVFNGKAVVHEGAQQSNARQTSRNLLLTPGAEIDTKPELEIYADDVKCSHGATTGQLDPAALFYLRSRGLGAAEARSVLTRAFAGPVLSRVDIPELARHVHDTLDARLTRLLEVAS